MEKEHLNAWIHSLIFNIFRLTKWAVSAKLSHPVIDRLAIKSDRRKLTLLFEYQLFPIIVFKANDKKTVSLVPAYVLISPSAHRTVPSITEAFILLEYPTRLSIEAS